MKNAWRLLAAVCVLVVAVYAFMARSGKLELLSPKASEAYYNLLVQGFRAGQLSLKKEVPPGLAQLADPYDPTANALYRDPPYNLWDLSYYHGRLYLYFGVTPALLLFWPYAALTGHYLFHRQAVTIFCALGFLASVGLLRALWRRYFAEINVAVVAACALALGLANGVPMLLSQSDVYEVPISCGYMLVMLALAAIWCALHETERRCRWLAAASVAYGLAVGARPNLLFGAVILLVPVVHAWREPRPRRLSGLMAAMGPITLIGLGLMLYNARRFDNPFEFGVNHYHLMGVPEIPLLFNLDRLWFNFRVYFLEPARWSIRFPFVHEISLPPLRPDRVFAGKAFGVLCNIPLVWLALAAPLAWRNRSAEARSVLRWFVMAVALLFGTCALTLGFYVVTTMYYRVDFLPALVLLAVVGIFGVERIMLADRPTRWRGARWGWGLLLVFSVAFNLLASVDRYAETHFEAGVDLKRVGRVPEAMEQYELALRIKPDFAGAHEYLGGALFGLGKVQEAIAHYEQALRIKPDYVEAHDNWGTALLQLGKTQEAIEHYEQALRVAPDFAEAHYNLGIVLARAGRIPEGIGHFEQAVRFKPDFADAHNNLGACLSRLGRAQEAIAHWEQAVRFKPDFADAHYNLGIAFAETGRIPEAIEHLEQALRVGPDSPEAHCNLGGALARAGRILEAIEHLEHALRIKPDYAEAHNNLGVCLRQLGKAQEAIAHWEQAVRIKPDYAEAHCNLGIAFAQTGKIPEAIEHLEQALRIKPDFAGARNALARVQGRQ